MLRTMLVGASLLWSSTAMAAGIAVVDFQRAVTETDEGKAAQTRIDTMYNTRKGEIERMQTDLEKEMQDYQARAMILSEQARAETEQGLMLKQRQFEQTYMQYQQEMQQTYYTLLSDLDEKMRKIAVDVAKERDYDVVLDSAVIVYTGPNVVDMTNDLVAKYNSTHK